MDPPELILVSAAAFLGATIHSATGFGFALLLGPALFAALEPAEAITTLLVLGGLLNLLIVAGEQRSSSVRRSELVAVLAWSVPGLVAGVVILLALAKPVLQMIVGVCVLGAVALLVRHGTAEGARVSVAAQGFAGFIAGALTTTTGTNGPPLVLLLERAGATPAERRDTLAAMFLGLNLIGGVALMLAGKDVALPAPTVTLALIALVASGRQAGRMVFERLEPGPFRIVGLALIVVAGFASIVAGLAA